jgi:hypothetical protein
MSATAQTGRWSLAPRTSRTTPALLGLDGASPRTKTWSQVNQATVGSIRLVSHT